jgi:hypothetical protein
MSTEIVCAQCETVIGRMVQVNDAPMLKVGEVIMYAMHGYCVKCGRSFHFNTSEKKLEALLEKIKAARTELGPKSD